MFASISENEPQQVEAGWHESKTERKKKKEKKANPSHMMTQARIERATSAVNTLTSLSVADADHPPPGP